MLKNFSIEQKDNKIIVSSENKTEDTMILNVLINNTIDSSDIVSQCLADDSVDESQFELDKDGFYTIYRIVIPTLKWISDRTDDITEILKYDNIYVIDDNTYRNLQMVLPMTMYKTRNFYNAIKSAAKSTMGRSSFSLSGAQASIKDRFQALKEQGFGNVFMRNLKEFRDTLQGKQYENATSESTGYDLVSSTRRATMKTNETLGRTTNNARPGEIAIYDNEGIQNIERTKGRTSMDLMMDDLAGIKVGDKTAYGKISKIIKNDDESLPPSYQTYFKNKNGKGKIVFNELDDQTGIALKNGKIIYWNKDLPDSSKVIGDVSISNSDKAWTLVKILKEIKFL